MSFQDSIDNANKAAKQYLINSGGIHIPAPESPAQPEPMTIEKMLADGGVVSPEDRQQIVDAYNKQFNDPQVNAVSRLQQASPSDGNVQRQIASIPPSPAPQAQGPGAAQSLLSSLQVKQPIDMGKFNPLGNVPRGTSGPTVDQLMAKLNGQNDPALQAAQASRNQMQLFSLLGKASNQILGGQTHTKPSDAVFDELGKNAGQGITDLGTRNALLTENLKQQDMGSKLIDEQAKGDPNSSVSQLYRAAVEKMLHGKLPDNISAAQLDKVSPVFEKIYQAEQSSLDRTARMQEMNGIRQKGLDLRTDNSAQTVYDKNTGPFANRIEGANRIQHVLENVKSGKIIDTNSLYNALNSEISQLFLNTQSGGSLTDREDQRINSLQASQAKLGAYVGKPMSAIPKDFLPQLEQEIQLLKHEYLSALSRKSNELQAGTSIQGKKDVFANRTKSFLDQQNINPQTLEKNAPSGYPRKVYKDGHEATVSSDQELKEANSEGFQ